MKRILPVLLVLAAALPATPAAAQAATRAVSLAGPGEKVTAPVEIEILPQADPGPGRRRVRIVARPGVTAASLQLEVSADNGLALAPGGTATWTTPAVAGEEVAREVDFVVAGSGELRIVVTATVKYGDDFSQTGIHEFALNPAAAVRTFGVTSGDPAPAVDRTGRRVLEIPAKTP